MDAERIARKISEFQRQFNQQQPTRQNEVEAHDSSDENEEYVDDEEERTLFVAGLDERVTETILYELFYQAGPLESVRIPKDKAGRNRAFGFIIYKHKCSPPYAMRIFKGVSLFRKIITLKHNNSTQPPPMERIWLPEIPDSKRYNHKNNRNQGRYDESADLSASLLRLGADDWMKGSAGRVIVKQPPQHNNNRRQDFNAHHDSRRHQNDRRHNRNNRRSDQRNGHYNRNSF